MLEKFILKLSERCSRSLKFLVTALVLAVILYPKFPFISIPGTYVAVRLEDFLLFFLFIAYGFSVLPRFKSLFKNKLNLALFLFLGITLIATLAGIFLTKTVVLHIGILNWARRVEYLVPFFAGYEVIKRNGDL